MGPPGTPPGTPWDPLESNLVDELFYGNNAAEVKEIHNKKILRFLCLKRLFWAKICKNNVITEKNLIIETLIILKLLYIFFEFKLTDFR